MIRKLIICILFTGTALGQTYDDYQLGQAEKYLSCDMYDEASTRYDSLCQSTEANVRENALVGRLVVAMRNFDEGKIATLVEALRDKPNLLAALAGEYAHPTRLSSVRLCKEAMEKCQLDSVLRAQFQAFVARFADDEDVEPEIRRLEQICTDPIELGYHYYKIAKYVEKRRHWDQALRYMRLAKDLLANVENPSENNQAVRAPLAIEQIRIKKLMASTDPKYQGMGDPDAALREIERIKIQYAEDPYLPVVLFNCAIGLRGTPQRYDEAHDLCEWILANWGDKMNDPDNYHLCACNWMCGFVQQKKGNLTKAIEYFGKSLAIAEKHPGPDIRNPGITEFRIAGLYKKMGDKKAAAVHYEKALSYQSPRTNLLGRGAYNNLQRRAALDLAESAKDKEAWEQAAFWYDAFLGLYPDDFRPPTILYEQGCCWEKAGQQELAAQSFIGFLQRAPSSDIRIAPIREKLAGMKLDPSYAADVVGGFGTDRWETTGDLSQCTLYEGASLGNCGCPEGTLTTDPDNDCLFCTWPLCVRNANIMRFDTRKHCQALCGWKGGDRCQIDPDSWYDGCAEWKLTALKDCFHRFDCDDSNWYNDSKVCLSIYSGGGIYQCVCSLLLDEAPCWVGTWWFACLASKA